MADTLTASKAPAPGKSSSEATGHAIDTRQVWNGMWRATCSCGDWSLFVPEKQEALRWADDHSRRTATQQEETNR